MDDRPVKALLFDLDNTLIETSKAGAEALQKTSQFLKTTLDLDDTTTTSICDKFKHKLFHEKLHRSAGECIDDIRVRHWKESLEETLGSCPTASLPAECYFLWKDTRLGLLCLTPAVCDLLKQLRCTYKLMLLTNGEAQTQREKVNVTHCEEYFDAIVVGGEHKEQKPYISIFKLCFDLLEVDAQECVMVGDNLDTDIQGGLNAGVRATVWVNPVGPVSSGSVKPDYTLPTVLELPDVLAQLH
ncbi:N-acylneuraminate-9-phosphatase [Gouania willdenowi]|uniref:N-acetylneuraminic acid phosphatase n=1 Tax=Gouania willdenowi TaxID=441366 RepID=A0A8C5D9M1_GOUWI|nr:N-acylneuraminate-9-phosphatase [Gouania willdenowi]